MFFFFIKLNNFLISVQILPHNYSAFFYRLTAEHALKHFHKIHIRIFDIQNRLKITNPQQYNTFICVFIYLLLQWWIRGKAKYIPREHKRHLGKKKTLTVTLWRLRTEEIITHKYLGHAFHLRHKSKPTDSPWNEIDQITFWGGNKSSLTSSSLAVKMCI